MALLDLSTGEFSAAEYAGADGMQALADEIAVLKPREIIVAAVRRDGAALAIAEALPMIAASGLPVTPVDGWTFDHESARRTLLDQLRVGGLEGFGLDRHPAAVSAAGALVHYLRTTQKVDLAHVRAIAYRQRADALLIDPTTLKHLEILEGSEGGRGGSLLDELDRTMTSVGSRLLRAWLLRPLVALEPIRDRLDAVEELAFRSDRPRQVPRHDQGRPGSRAARRARGARHRRARAIWSASSSRSRSFRASGPCSTSCRRRSSARSSPELDDLADVRDAIESTLIDDPPALAREGGFARDGVDPELDELRTISRSGKQIIAEMEERERARTGIASLKVRYNRVFGYYIEVSKSNLHAVPPDYHRKQTIAGGERFITPALKEYEEKVLGADERIVERELEIFETLRAAVAAEAPRIQASARALAALDVLAALAECAAINNYIKPHVHDGDELVVLDGRHPVVERRLRRRRRLRAQRHHAERDDVPARHPDGAEHGRQVHLPAADGAHLPHGAGRLVRAGARGEDPARRSHLRARRRVGQHRARPFDVHGRDAGDGEHPAHRDVAQPRRARRDRARHGHLRRPEHRLGGRRASGDQSPGIARRRCSRRTTTS